MAERPREAYFTSIRKIGRIAFLSKPMGDFRGNVSVLYLARR